MIKVYKFFHGYTEKTLTEQWAEILNDYPTTINTPVFIPTWTGTNYTITTTPGTGTYTIPYNGPTTFGTISGYSLTTSNTNGTTTYTTGGIGGTLTTGTATYSSSSFKLQ
jgi:hypothetical protein